MLQKTVLGFFFGKSLVLVFHKNHNTEMDFWHVLTSALKESSAVKKKDMTYRGSFGNQNSTLGSVVPLAMFTRVKGQMPLYFDVHRDICL